MSEAVKLEAGPSEALLIQLRSIGWLKMLQQKLGHGRSLDRPWKKTEVASKPFSISGHKMKPLTSIAGEYWHLLGMILSDGKSSLAKRNSINPVNMSSYGAVPRLFVFCGLALGLRHLHAQVSRQVLTKFWQNPDNFWVLYNPVNIWLD